MNGWGTDNEFMYQGSGVYTVDIDLSAGATEFKVASDDWSTVNLGNPDGETSNVVTPDSPKTISTSNNNLLIDVPAGTYEFKVEGPDGGNPTLTVTEK